jgi:hypothetical protein
MFLGYKIYGKGDGSRWVALLSYWISRSSSPSLSPVVILRTGIWAEVWAEVALAWAVLGEVVNHCELERGNVTIKPN